MTRNFNQPVPLRDIKVNVGGIIRDAGRNGLVLVSGSNRIEHFTIVVSSPVRGERLRAKCQNP